MTDEAVVESEVAMSAGESSRGRFGGCDSCSLPVAAAEEDASAVGPRVLSAQERFTPDDAEAAAVAVASTSMIGADDAADESDDAACGRARDMPLARRDGRWSGG